MVTTWTNTETDYRLQSGITGLQSRGRARRLEALPIAPFPFPAHQTGITVTLYSTPILRHAARSRGFEFPPWPVRSLLRLFPHHLTQRGNRRERVFFGDDDYELYRDLLASQCRKRGVACWATCLMPNQLHLILVPHREEALARALVAAVDDRGRRAQRARLQTRACRVTGHLFQSRFGSAVTDEDHLVAAARTLIRPASGQGGKGTPVRAACRPRVRTGAGRA